MKLFVYAIHLTPCESSPVLRKEVECFGKTFGLPKAFWWFTKYFRTIHEY